MDLSTRYLGLTLRNPLVASASPLTRELGNLHRLEDLGVGAVVMPSIFEEQIEHEGELIENLVTIGRDGYAEALSYFPTSASYAVGPGRYLDVLRRAAASLEIPVIASLNGVTNRGWIGYAREIEDAGAHALELNVYFVPADPALAGRDVERRYLDILRAVKEAVKIPVAVKLNPYFSSIGHMALELDRAGADGLVLFNRFYQPDINLARLAVQPDLELSSAREIRLPLLWIGVLAGRVKASLGASTGVESADEVVKYLLAGADVAMTTSALLRHGLDHAKVLLDGLVEWLHVRDLDTLERVRGRMSLANVEDKEAFERANYIKILQGYRVG